MISALADASAVAGPASSDAAVRAMTFVETSLVTWDDDRRIARVARHSAGGAAKGFGFLDDHAFVADAALDVYEATGDPRWVGPARGLAEAILAHFYDAADATFLFPRRPMAKPSSSAPKTGSTTRSRAHPRWRASSSCA